ncbi:MAG TPA: EAL domain-containing protein [Rhizobium sp.]
MAKKPRDAKNPDGADAPELMQAPASVAHESQENESQESRHSWCPDGPEIDLASPHAAHLLDDMVPALAGKGQLRLVYQPKTDLSTSRCIGAEALLRWNHPTLGAVPPDEFVPLVEHTSLMNAMTDWAFAAALPQVAVWRAEGFAPQISINVSMRDLSDERFATRLAEMLERHGVRPDWIDIEVTESADMKDPACTKRQLDEIRRLGVAIEIDDYGTGHAGLSYLKLVPASYLKIDQAFISHLATDSTDQIIVRSTIDLAHKLGLKVVAEGIRDEAALGWLREHGCDIGQGNLLSPPLEAEDFERLLRAQQQLVPIR